MSDPIRFVATLNEREAGQVIGDWFGLMTAPLPESSRDGLYEVVVTIEPMSVPSRLTTEGLNEVQPRTLPDGLGPAASGRGGSHETNPPKKIPAASDPHDAPRSQGRPTRRGRAK